MDALAGGEHHDPARLPDGERASARWRRSTGPRPPPPRACSSSSSSPHAGVDRGQARAGVRARRGLDHAAVERDQPAALVRDHAVAGVGDAGVDAEDDHVHAGILRGGPDAFPGLARGFAWLGWTWPGGRIAVRMRGDAIDRSPRPPGPHHDRGRPRAPRAARPRPPRGRPVRRRPGRRRALGLPALRPVRGRRGAHGAPARAGAPSERPAVLRGRRSDGAAAGVVSPTCGSSPRTAASRSATSGSARRCSARRPRPRRSSCSRARPSTGSATAASSGSATPPTTARAARPSASASRSRASSAST